MDSENSPSYFRKNHPQNKPDLTFLNGNDVAVTMVYKMPHFLVKTTAFMAVLGIS